MDSTWFFCCLLLLSLRHSAQKCQQCIDFNFRKKNTEESLLRLLFVFQKRKKNLYLSSSLRLRHICLAIWNALWVRRGCCWLILINIHNKNVYISTIGFLLCGANESVLAFCNWMCVRASRLHACMQCALVPHHASAQKTSWQERRKKVHPIAILTWPSSQHMLTVTLRSVTQYNNISAVDRRTVTLQIHTCVRPKRTI